MTEKMKPSGIACIGDIPSNWQVKRLKYACRKITDGSHFSPETVDEGKIYITVSDLYGNAIHTDTAKRITPSDFVELVKNGCKPNPGDVLLSKDGTVGRSAIVNSNNDYVVLSSIGILTPGARLSSNYLKYNLDGSHLQEQMLRAMDGSALKRITISKIAEFFAVIPPIEEQNAIANFLDAQCTKIDSVIADIEKQIETLQKYKKSLITEAVTKGLNRSVLMKDSGVEWIGDIPETWGCKKLKYIISESLQYGANEAGEDYRDDYPRYIRITDITEENSLKDEGKLSLPPDVAAPYILMNGDILFARSGATVGKTFFYTEDCGLAAFAGYLIRARINSEMALPRFVYYSTLGVGYENWKNTVFTQATIQNIGADKYAQFFVTLPQIDEQKSIVEYLDTKCVQIDDIIKNKQQQLVAVQRHKKSLIYEYVTGKKRVTEVN